MSMSSYKFYTHCFSLDRNEYKWFFGSNISKNKKNICPKFELPSSREFQKINLFFDELIREIIVFKRVKKNWRMWMGSGATATKGGTSPRRIVEKLWHVYERVARGQRAKKHYRKISGVQLMPWVLITQRGVFPTGPVRHPFTFWNVEDSDTPRFWLHRI